MATNDNKSGYWSGPRVKGSPTAQAHAISKTAWMNLYYDLYLQTHSEFLPDQEDVIADAKKRLKHLRVTGLRR
jgi:hypothetical protein